MLISMQNKVSENVTLPNLQKLLTQYQQFMWNGVKIHSIIKIKSYYFLTSAIKLFSVISLKWYYSEWTTL